MAEHREPMMVNPEDSEKLIAIFHPKRVGFLFYYVSGAIILFVGFLHNILVAARMLYYHYFMLIAANLGIIVGASMMLIVEIRRRRSKYIFTTWNVRSKKGFFKQNTEKAFYDQIIDVRVPMDQDEIRANVGDVEIYTIESGNEPHIVFDHIHNPRGIECLIHTFVKATPEVPIWDHIERGPTTRDIRA